MNEFCRSGEITFWIVVEYACWFPPLLHLAPLQVLCGSSVLHYINPACRSRFGTHPVWIKGTTVSSVFCKCIQIGKCCSWSAQRNLARGSSFSCGESAALQSRSSPSKSGLGLFLSNLSWVCLHRVCLPGIFCLHGPDLHLFCVNSCWAWCSVIKH